MSDFKTKRETKIVPACNVREGDVIASFLAFSPSGLPDADEPGHSTNYNGVPWGTVTQVLDNGETVSIQTDICGPGEWSAECDRNEPVAIYA